MVAGLQLLYIYVIAGTLVTHMQQNKLTILFVWGVVSLPIESGPFAMAQLHER